MKGTIHKEQYVNYIATRDGVEKIENSHGKEPATKKQKELIENLLNDFDGSAGLFEYEDYIKEPNRENASELIQTIMEQNLSEISTKENYVSYIANRPRVEKLGEHGLFSDAGKEIDLSQVSEEVKNHEGEVWTHIISLKREDAERLGYDNAESWMQLCRSKRNELAEAMRIDCNDLKWYAAFHNEAHHPHIHMICYSQNQKKGFVTNEGINKIRKMFASEIFHQDLLHIYKEQTKTRDEVKQYSRAVVRNTIDDLSKNPIIDNETMNKKVMELKEFLQDYHGKLVYAYIPKQAKEIIDTIVKEIEQEEHIKVLYEQYQLYQQEVHKTYHDKLLDCLPLSRQKEFKSIKNMILKEVMQYNPKAIMYDEQLQDREFLEHLPFSQNERFEEIQTMADLGDDYAQVYVANELLKGEKVAKDVQQSISYLQNSAEHENPFAQYMLGKLFLYGDAITRDEELALEYLEKATIQGNGYAKYLLENKDIFYQPNTALLTSRFFYHVSNIFHKTMPSDTNLLVHVDKKLAHKIKLKKIEQGHNVHETKVNIRQQR